MGKKTINKNLFALQYKSLFMLVAFLFPMLGQASPNNFNFQANIRKPDGTRLEDSNVSYRFSYLNTLGTCTIYIEDFNNVSMIGTSGNISFSMGTGTKVFPPASVSLSETFSNSTANLMSCSEGGSYTPLAATETRKLKVEFVYTGSGGVQSLNGIEISSVPYSMYSSDSDRLGGVMANLFAKISDFQTCSPGEFLYKDGAGHFYCDTPSSFSGSLTGDVSGTQAATTVTRLRGIPLAVTAPTLNQVLQFDGTNWVPQTIAASGGTVTNVSSTNLYLTVANPATTPTLTLNVGTVANTVAAGDDSRIVGAFQAATTLSGDLSGTLPNPTVATVGGKTAAQISTSVDDTTNATNAATASRIVKRDGSGNAAFNTASANNFSGRNLVLFEPTDTNSVTVSAPTTFAAGNYVLTLPDSNGSPGQVLSTDGNGVTSWIPASTGSVTSVGATLPLTSTGGATPTIAMPAAATAQDGYLTSADWNTFNNKQTAGAYITALTGDVVAAGPGSSAATIQANAITTSKINNLAVTDAKINDVAFSKITGKPTTLVGYGITDAVSSTLAPGNIFVGNGSSVATGVMLSGDVASVSNTGSVTLASTVTAGTVGSASAVPTITYDAKGRITSTSSNAYQDATGATKGIVQAGANISVTGGVMSVPTANGVVAGVVSATDYNTFNNKVSSQWSNNSADIYFNTGKVGIGTNIPYAPLHIVAPNLSGGSNNDGNLYVQTSDAQGINVGGSLGFGGLDGGGSDRVFATAAGRKENGTSGNYAGYFAIETRPNGGSLAEGLRVTSIGRVGIGLTNPSYKLDVNGDINIPAGSNFKINGVNIASGTVTGTGTTNRLSKFTAAGAIGDSSISDSGTNVTVTNNMSIGPTFTPQSKLSIGSSMGAGYRAWMDNGITFGKVGESDGGYIGIKDEGANRQDTVIAWGDDATDVLRFINVRSGGPVDGDEYMRIDAIGQVGIGTNNPTSKLTVTGGTSGQPAIRVNSTYSRSWNTEPADVAFASTNPIGSGITLIPSASGTYPNGWTMYSGAASSVIGDGSFGIWNATTADAKFMINQAGNVGIGRTTANYKLDVNGDVNIPAGSNFKINGVNIASGTIGGSGTTNKISKFTAAGTIGDSNITDNGTVVSTSTDMTVNGITVGLGIGNNSYSTVFGTGALAANTTGERNVAVGRNVSASNTTGNWNTAIGTESFQFNTTGSANAAVGDYALHANTSGHNNTAVGDDALINNTTASNNTAVGQSALYNSTGGNNTGLGYSAGSAITTGAYNVVIGSNDGSAIATSSNNIILSDGQGNIRQQINSSGQVGIGIAPSTYMLSVNGDVNIPAGSNFKINGVNIGSGTIGGSGTTNKISKFTAAGTIGDSNITDNGTTVAISTDATVNGINISRGPGALTGNQAVGSSSLNAITTGTSNTAVGHNTLSLTTTGATNSAFGTSALQMNTTGNANTAFGSSALRQNTTGITNVAIGSNALPANTTGSHNVHIGFFSGYQNTTGQENTALGTNALQSNISGNYNSAIGRQSLRNTTGSNNIGLGYNSGFDITTGSNNVVIGSNTGSTIATANNNIIISDGAGNIRQQIDSSGLVGIGMAPSTYMLSVNGDINLPAGSNFKINGTNVGTGTVTGTGTTGVIPKFTAAGAIGDSNINDNGMFVIVSTDTVINSVKVGRGLASVSTNTAVGTNSLGANTTGNQNTANGYFTLYLNTTGTQNTATGSGALYNNTTGSRSTAVGASALNQNTTGTDNTAIGFSSISQNTTGHNNTAVGVSTLASNTTGYYNSAFGGLALNANTTGNVNAASGFQALYYNTTGSSNAALGFQALYNNISGDDNTGIGARALTDNTTGYNNSAMGADALANNTTGTYNTASGSQALLTNTTGSNNTASGMYALRANTVGDGNTTSGSNSMYSNTTGNYNVANGHQALYYNTTGSYNVATGYQALFNNTTAGSNVAYGSQSLNSNTTGNSNVAIGSQTLFTNTTGGSNTATGSNALRANTTGMLNAAFGYAALYGNTTGLGNVAVGSSSQYTSTTANYNASLGYQALYATTTGGNNTAVGAESLYTNTTGNSNSAVGYRSLYSNTTGIYNTGIGSGSLYTNSTGNFNTASGNSALYSNTTGSNNTATGYLALTSNTTGSSNNAYGRYSLRFNTTGFSNSAFGNNALTTNTTGYNNAAFGEDSLTANTTGTNNVSFGIGSMAANTTGTQNAAFGFQTLNGNTTGSFNVGLGYGALSGNTAGNQNIAIGSSSGSALTSGNYNVILGANTGSTINGTSNNILISDGSGLLRASFNGSGNLGIGVAPTGEKITVYNGSTTGTYTTSGWMHSSDARLKHDITPLQNSLDKILKLTGVEYTFNNDPANAKQIGFIAQQVEPIFPEVVRTDEKGFKSMIYSNLVAPIIEAIKSLKAMTDTNTREIASLKAENEELKKQLEKQNKDMEQIKKKLGL